jgi:hypothetical protein
MSKIIGFFSGKTSNRESPNKQKKSDDFTSPQRSSITKPIIDTR